MTIRLRRFTVSIRRARTMPVRLGRWKKFTRSEGTMSVETEVVPEKKTKAEPFLDAPVEKEAPKGFANPKVQRLAIVGGVVLVVAVLGLFLYYHDRESTDDAQIDGHIMPIASKIYGKVASVLVNDNQAVKAGQLLGSQADVARAQATYELAQTADLAFAQANVNKSMANAALAQADLARYKPLMERDEISKQQYDAAKANADATASALKADQEKLAQAQRNVEVVKAQLDAAKARVLQMRAGVESALADRKQVGMRTADAQAKVAKVAQARASLDAAQLNLSYTDVVAPVDGVATHKQVETGQIVQAGQGLLVVVPLQDVWVTANFKETQLRNMRAGQKAEVSVDTYGRTFSGHVDSIAGATGGVLSLLPPENATGNYVKVVQRIPVKIVLDPVPPDKAVLRPGMNVDATVITK